MGIMLPMDRTVLTDSKGVFMCHHGQLKLSEGEGVQCVSKEGCST